MAGLDSGLTGSDALAAILFLGAVNETMQAYGTLNSSPWTAESFGADDRRAAAMREYVAHAVVFSMGTAAIAAYLAEGRKATWSIFLGTAGVNAYLVWLYLRASKRGREAGAANWSNAVSGGTKWA